MRHFSRLQWGAFAVLCVIGVLYGLLSLVTPDLYDDLIFKNCYLEHYDATGSIVESYKRYVSEIRMCDNSRIANILSPLTTIFEPWRTIFPWATGALFAAIIAMCARMSSGRVLNPVAVAFAWLLCLLALPLRNNIFVADYSLNYIYSGAINLLFIALMLKLARRGGKASWRFYAVTIVMALLCAGWHEGFALPTLSGLFVWGALERVKSKRWWGIIVLAGVVLLLFALSPGMINRGDRQIAWNVGNMARICGHQFLVVITAGALAVSLLTRRRKAVVDIVRHDGVLVVTGIAALMGLGIAFFVSETARVAFWPQLCAILFVMRYIFIVRPAWFVPRCSVFAVVAVVICSVLTVLIIMRQRDFSRERDEILAQFEKVRGTTNTVFYDVMMPEDEPLYYLHIPVSESWVETYSYKSLLAELKAPIAVVPTALNRDLGSDPAVRVLQGNAGLRITPEGVLFAPLPAADFYINSQVVSYEMSDGTTRDYDDFIIAFTDAAGTPWVYIRPIGRLFMEDFNPSEVVGANIYEPLSREYYTATGQLGHAND